MKIPDNYRELKRNEYPTKGDYYVVKNNPSDVRIMGFNDKLSVANYPNCVSSADAIPKK